LPEVAALYPRERIIRSFAEKRESNRLKAVTDFRYIPKLIESARGGQVERPLLEAAIKILIDDPAATPRSMFNGIGADAYAQHTLSRKVELLSEDLAALRTDGVLSIPLRAALTALREMIDRLLS
jgi:hypothetical protein